MPSPIDILLDPVSLSILGIYLFIIVWEMFFPARALPKVKYWKLRGIIAFTCYFYISSYLPVFINPLLEPYRLLDLSQLGIFGGSCIAILMLEFSVFLWHRQMHRSGKLWKVFHQMHHSAERIDTYGAFYFSPFDMIGWTLLGSICFALLAGLPAQAVTVAFLVNAFLGVFQHANIRTPQWLGYIIQRPESHRHHHAREIHQHNYSDLPVFDMIFGSFHNPETFENETGFYHGASGRVGDMLMFKDVSKPKKTELLDIPFIAVSDDK